MVSPNVCQENLARYLSWDTVCECPFANFDQIKDEEEVLKKTRQINEWLLATFHNKKHEGLDLSLYRLSDKVMKQFILGNSGEEIKSKKIIPYLLEKGKDLCDVDVIDYATVAKKPSIIITADKPEVIRQRLITQLKTLRFLCIVKGSKLHLSPGLILFVDQDSCVVYDKLDVNEINIKEGLVLSIEPTLSKRDQVSFNTRSYRKELEKFNL